MLVVEWERLTRDETLQDTIIIKKILRDNGVKVGTPWQIFDLRDDEDDFVSDLFSILSKREKKKLLKRSRRGRLKAKQKGHFLGEYLPYGFTAAEKKLSGEDRKVTVIEFHPEEKVGLEKIVELAEQGLCSREIAKEMTRLGFKTKTGRECWNKATVTQLLQRTWLYGDAVFGRKKTKIIGGKRETIHHPEEEWVHYNVPALISKSRWDSIQAGIARRRLRPSQKRVHKYLFSDILKCGSCIKQTIERSIKRRSSKWSC